MTTFTVVLFGSKNTGKTAFIHKLSTGQFEEKHIRNIGREISQVQINTNYGTIQFLVWDVAGQDGGKYYLPAVDGAISFHANGLPPTMFRSYSGKTAIPPVIRVLNKIDLDDSNPENIACCISTKNMDQEQLSEPFVQLARQLTGHDDLYFFSQKKSMSKKGSQGISEIRHCQKKVKN